MKREQTDPKAPRRPYRSTLRDAHARATRRRIVEAGAQLFVERGYAHTTIDAIAERAEVSRKTVFTSVGGKAAVLKLSFDWAVAGDDEPVPMADRPHVQRILEQSDAADMIADWVTMNAAIAGRLVGLWHVLVVAADGDAEAAALLETLDAQRVAGARTVATRLLEVGGVRPELGLDEVTAIVDLLIDPSPYGRLVLQQGWSPAAYIDYVRRAGFATLLAERD